MIIPERAGLTPQQITVLTLIAQGYTNQQIAEKLRITRGTVECHVHGVLRKLGVRNRTEAAYWVLQYGLTGWTMPSDRARYTAKT